ncbi:efflux RND transporter periplasmic adaptor subunit [Legionella sp. MW5194]|uniref:efflux RND transporter periplasmic adaptor subunit n=1 Tax=Legionella sp. MW5194 TaxID=2662448 RepID=UPI00193E02E4|nr:efflux RND transporter periplasmic adaptor subunit [Legionella sp. MW5194]QRN02817.1 efflux RND transporter periplasmic adaptor subunit [Legionella sp. MW5194]
MKKIVFMALFLLVGFSLYFFLRTHEVETIHPQVEKAEKIVYATGEVEPVKWAKIAASKTATVEQINVVEGQEIKAGQVLAYQNNRVEKAALTSFLSRLDYLKKENERYQTLLKKNLVSVTAAEEALSNYEQALANYEGQKKLLDRITLVSPIDGILLRKDIELGELAKSGTTIFWVGKPKPLQITALVDEEDIPLVHVGQLVLIKSDAYPNQVMTGKIKKMTPKGDPETRQFRVRISLPNNTPLLIGMTVEINIVTEVVNDALMVPLSAVHEGKVYRKTAQGYEPIAVRTGITTLQKVQLITDNIKATDRLLLNPAQSLRH